MQSSVSSAAGVRDRVTPRNRRRAGKHRYRQSGDIMSATLVRRILYGAMAAWVLIMAFEEFRVSGHTGTAIAFGVGGLVLAVLAISGKGG